MAAFLLTGSALCCTLIGWHLAAAVALVPGVVVTAAYLILD